jgi:hypothetical protein
MSWTTGEDLKELELLLFNYCLLKNELSVSSTNTLFNVLTEKE